MWKDKSISIKDIKQQFPSIKQVPDIYINLYTNTYLNGDRRVGFIRISASEVRSKEPKPMWRRLKPLGDEKSPSPGMLLCNIQFLEEANAPYRIPKQRTPAASYSFVAQIFYGYEVAPTWDASTLNTFVSVKIGDKTESCKPAPGKNPTWNQEIYAKKVELNQKLEFSSDMIVSVFNANKGITSIFNEKSLIGEFAVPVMSLQKDMKRPKFFNLIKDGQCQGRILARFLVRDFQHQ